MPSEKEIWVLTNRNTGAVVLNLGVYALEREAEKQASWFNGEFGRLNISGAACYVPKRYVLAEGKAEGHPKVFWDLVFSGLVVALAAIVTLVLGWIVIRP